MSVSPKEKVQFSLKAIFGLSECPSVCVCKLPRNPEICAKGSYAKCPEYRARKNAWKKPNVKL